jgi:hypothetical protein
MRLRTVALLAGLGLGLIVSLGGCGRHVHHHHPPGPVVKKVVVLDQEHDERAIVIVHARPRADRHCWRHDVHWHCRAR